jgi:nucleoside-diphosphate-sugar epimerase
VRRLLITGASGFIGRHCLSLAASYGSFDELHAAGRRSVDDGTAIWHVADLRESRQAEELVRSVRPTHLLHCAWIATPGVYLRSPENLDWLTVTIALARAFGEQGGARFVGVGSSAEYAPTAGLCREDVTPIQPNSVYGKCKAASWQAIQAAGQHHGYSCAWGRIFLPYGPGDSAQRLVPSLVTALRAGKPIETTHGRQLRDFIFAPDAAGLLVRLVAGTGSGAYNVGTGRGVPVRQAIEILAKTLGAAPDLLRFGARPLAEGEPMELVADMDKVGREFAWSAATSLEDGLAWAAANPIV